MTIISRYFSLGTNGNKPGSNLDWTYKRFGLSSLQASMFESETAKPRARRVGCSKSESITGRIEDKKTSSTVYPVIKRCPIIVSVYDREERLNPKSKRSHHDINLTS
jgi:hypothetical protein